MAISDTISDALTKIRNAARARHTQVDVRSSTHLQAILDVLQREGYIRTYKRLEVEHRNLLRVYLNTPRGLISSIKALRRISTPGRRQYIGYREIQRAVSDRGTTVLSTPQGVLSAREAIQRRVGGELLCSIW